MLVLTLPGGFFLNANECQVHSDLPSGQLMDDLQAKVLGTNHLKDWGATLCPGDAVA